MSIRQYLGKLVVAQLNHTPVPEVPEGVTAEEIIDIARRNNVDYLLLGAAVNSPNMEEGGKEQMRKLVVSSVMRTGVQVEQLRMIMERFEKEGIKNQPMKGARLKYLYPTPALREMSDIDILVDENDMKRAGEIMNELGYKLQASVKHHDIYVKPPFMVVEVHRSMYDKTVDVGQYRYFSSFSRAVLMEGKQYTYDFAPEDFYVYLIAHMAKHFYAMGCGIRNLVDVYVYLQKNEAIMNWDYTREQLELCGIGTFAKHVEEMAKIWLEDLECSEFYENLFQYMMDSGIYGKDENGIWNKFAEEKIGNKKVSNSKLKRWYYFPPVSYMAEYYPWLEDKPFLLPVAWCIRGYRGLFLKKGVHKREMLQNIGEEKIMVYKDIYQNMALKFKK